MQQSKKNQSLWLDRFERLTGLVLSPHRNRGKSLDNLEISNDFYKFEVHSLRGARRAGPTGNFVNQLIISITQTRNFKERNLKFRGGCTLILDLEDLTLRYVVGGKRIDDQARLERHLEYQGSLDRTSLQATYFGKSKKGEPFAFLHRSI